MAKRKRTGGSGRQRQTQNDPRAVVLLLDPLQILEDDLAQRVLSFLDVVTLVGTKRVNRRWRELCTAAIDGKCHNPKHFESNKELRDAVEQYCSKDPEAVERLAVIYAYPINKWNVSLLTDFSEIFSNQLEFNESIRLWDVSNATNMYRMFQYAKKFNQNVSSWNTSNVTNMAYMFQSATSFNQDVSSWNTSSVTHMSGMFVNAWSFNQDISSWDTSNVKRMTYMFAFARTFNLSL
jgi:surface protein